MKSVFSKFSLLVLFSCLLTSNVSFHNEEFVKPVKGIKRTDISVYCTWS